MKRYCLLVLTLLCCGLGSAQSAFTLSEGTEARFYIDEVLLGQDKTVLGATAEVTGSFSFDPANPATTEFGSISIDASALTTDDNRRTRQLRTRILGTEEEANRYIVFAPSSVTGLPETLAVGDSAEVSVTGDLTIRGVTREETFDVTLTLVSEGELHGTGSTVVAHADYGLSIPRVPMVASVSDEVTLELEFVAVAD